MRIDTPFAAFFSTTSIDFGDLLIANNTPCDTLESLRARKAAGETGLDAAIAKASRECTIYDAGGEILPRGGRFVDPEGTTPKGGSEPAEPPVKPVKPVRETDGSKKATAPSTLDF